MSVLLFLHIADDVLELDWEPLNLAWSGWLKTAGWLNVVAHLGSWMGGWLGYVAAFWLLLHLRRTHRHREVCCLALAIGGAIVLSWVLKHLMQVPRPLLNGLPIRPTWSFPSGHTLYATCVYGYWGARNWGRRHYGVALAMFSLVGLVGWSRLALGVHWVSDVLAGWLVGVAWVGLCLLVRHRLPKDE